jgi:hypothetical protein
VQKERSVVSSLGTGKYSGINILQAINGSIHPGGESASITCPHCGTHGTFFNALSYQLLYAKNNTAGQLLGNLFAKLLKCPNIKCQGLAFVVTEHGTGEVIYTSPSQLIDFDSSALPDNLLTTLKEAISCHAAGAYRACAMMIRRLLEEVCEASGSTGKDLHTRLEGLKTKITLPKELFDAMFELKALGNDAAHIEAKNYDNIGKEEAADGIELAKEILKALYQLKGLVDRLKARKT